MTAALHHTQRLAGRLGILFILVLVVVPATARRFDVTAYCYRGKTAMGTRPRPGICAGPRKYMGRYVRIYGKRFRVEDLCRTGFDIWMPTRKACLNFGRRHLPVTIGGSFIKRKKK